VRADWTDPVGSRMRTRARKRSGMRHVGCKKRGSEPPEGPWCSQETRIAH
jgi:hypothetical protein